jgi:membrane fusion protein, multidrug efflux system
MIRGLMVCGLILCAGCNQAASNHPGPAPAGSSAPGTDGLSVPLRVRVATASRGTLDASRTRSGVARAFQTATVAAEIGGRVASRKVDLGTNVNKGDVLAQLDVSTISLDVQYAKAAVDARTADLRFAESELARTQKLFDASAIADQHLDRAEHETQRARDGLQLARASAAKAADAYRRATSRAPFAGTVVACHVDPGDYVAPGKPIVTLADLSKIVVTAGLTAADAVRVEPGLRVRVVFDSLGGLEVDATLRGRAPAPDPSTGTYAAELVADNPDARILAGTLARVLIPGEQNTGVLIPKAAVTRFGGSPAVFVIQDQDGTTRAMRKSIRLGGEVGDSVEVLEGIAEGTRVVEDGVFALRDGAAVTIEGESVAVR